MDVFQFGLKALLGTQRNSEQPKSPLPASDRILGSYHDLFSAIPVIVLLQWT